jgi:hypothetical protein
MTRKQLSDWMRSLGFKLQAPDSQGPNPYPSKSGDNLRFFYENKKSTRYINARRILIIIDFTKGKFYREGCNHNKKNEIHTKNDLVELIRDEIYNIGASTGRAALRSDIMKERNKIFNAEHRLKCLIGC